MAAAPVETQLVQTRGLRFSVAMVGDGDKLALCLHGFPESSHSWRYQLPLLAKLGYRAWAPDLRGYGDTERPQGVHEYSMDKLEADVADLIDASGAESVLLIGHDWGAAIAWSFAMDQVRPLERLVIMNVPHPACFEKGIRSGAQLFRSWYMFFFQLPWLPELLFSASPRRTMERVFRSMAVDKSNFDDATIAVYADNLREKGAATAMLNYYRAAMRAGAGRRDYSEKIQTPTLMLWGEADQMLGKALTYDTYKYVEDLTLRYLPNVSHWVQQEAPDTVNEMLEAWLTGQPVPEAT